MSKDLLSTLGDALEALETHIDQFEKDAQQKIDGGKRVFEQYGDVLFADDATELSVMGQTMVSKMSTKAVNDAATLVTSHKALHAPVSKVGKEIERRMTKEVRELLRGEKDLEGDPRYQRLVERMISDHLMSTGFSGAAQVLDKEASLNGTLDQLPYDKDAVEAVMAAMENHDATPAIRWLEENAPQELHLKCDLIKQVIVEHLRQGNKEQAMEGMKVLATLGYEREMKEVAGALVLGSDCPRYQKLFSMQTWPALIARLSQVVYQLDSTLEDVVSTGVTTCMQLMKIKKRMEGRKDHIFSTEELPVSVSLKKCVHNLFTCPILKQQCTENNPPMKLHCGHVISRDAMHKLSSNTRNLRVKCPYCPSEASIADAKPVYF